MRIGVRGGTAAVVVAVAVSLIAGRGGELRKTAEAALATDSATGSQQLAAAEVPVSTPKPEERAPAVQPPASKKPQPKPAAKPDVPLEPLVALGRTDVGDGLYIERAGETVTVHFDTPETRTRRRDKFERVVRRTLPEIYGSAAEALLSSIPEGRLVEPVDLVTEIAERGVKLDAGDGWKVSLWPETRPGQDGPLVVSYRVAVTR